MIDRLTTIPKFACFTSPANGSVRGRKLIFNSEIQAVIQTVPSVMWHSLWESTKSWKLSLPLLASLPDKGPGIKGWGEGGVGLGPPPLGCRGAGCLSQVFSERKILLRNNLDAYIREEMKDWKPMSTQLKTLEKFNRISSKRTEEGNNKYK